MGPFLKYLAKEDTGSITTETALILIVLNTMAVGVLDFGLAYAHNMQLANSVRAGMQYALVRKPVNEDYSAIINAVNTAAPDAVDGSNRMVTAVLTCECPDGSAIDCVGENGEDLTCDGGDLRAAYLDLTISEDYALMFPYPGLPSPISLSQTVKVRLN